MTGQAFPGQIVRRQRLHRSLVAVDPRLLLLLACVAGVAVWHMGWWGLLALALGVGTLLALLWPLPPLPSGAGRGGIVFVLVWSGLHLLLGWWSDRSWSSALEGAGLLGLRLALLLAVGALLTAAASPRRMGLALAWLLRPFSPRVAWQAALALGLMVHFLPQALTTAAAVARTMARRCPQLSLWRRMRILAESVLRILASSTWDQAVAISARRLDRPDAWQGLGRPPWRQLALALLLAAAMLVLTWL